MLLALLIQNFKMRGQEAQRGAGLLMKMGERLKICGVK